MRKLLLSCLLIATNVCNVEAQGFKRFLPARPTKPVNPPCAPKIIGCIAIPVGAVVTTMGGYVYMASAPMKAGQTRSPKENLIYGVVIGGGATLLAGGIILLIADAAHHRNTRITLAAPKANELGIAYNF